MLVFWIRRSQKSVTIANSKVGVNRVKEAEAWVGNLVVTGGDMVETRRVAKSAEVSLEMAETSEHGGAQAAAGDLRNGRMKIIANRVYYGIFPIIAI